jgi:hypothetical protein
MDLWPRVESFPPRDDSGQSIKDIAAERRVVQKNVLRFPYGPHPVETATLVGPTVCVVMTHGGVPVAVVRDPIEAGWIALVYDGYVAPNVAVDPPPLIHQQPDLNIHWPITERTLPTTFESIGQRGPFHDRWLNIEQMKEDAEYRGRLLREAITNYEAAYRMTLDTLEDARNDRRRSQAICWAMAVAFVIVALVISLT